MAYVKTYLPTLKTHVVKLKRDAKDLSRDSQRLEVRGKLGSKTLYWLFTTTRKSFVIFTCSYFKLSWNATALTNHIAEISHVAL